MKFSKREIVLKIAIFEKVCNLLIINSGVFH